ncbi:hypothetical protein MOQ_001914 [Trypanosoma cruzi marinkellei]|uniref:Uncharacterized protein n=1 Tax=Trypanosoma cruzi marinkellei TaxID=85056 RepID=K2MRC8_TRYCR|nr:hypothetical protein MOQ_001914 [Trypanosoma cruzi marinkellei]
MAGSLPTAFAPSESMQDIDEETAVYCRSHDAMWLGFARELLSTLRNAAPEVQAKSEGQLESQRLCVGDFGLSSSPFTALEVLQDCCLKWEECRAEAEKGFLEYYFAMHSLASGTETKTGAVPVGQFMSTLFAGVPGTVGGDRLSEELRVERTRLCLANAIGLPLELPRGRDEKQLPQGMSTLEKALKSFRVVTDQTLPDCLYCTIEPLLCEMTSCWLLNGIFVNTPLRLIGTAEGMRLAKERLELHASSLRFLLELAEDEFRRCHTATALESKKKLEEMLLRVTVMQSATTRDGVVGQLAKEWRKAAEEARAVLASTEKTLLGVLPGQPIEAFDKLFQLSPHRVTDHIVHSFQLPLESTAPNHNVERVAGCSDVPTVIAAVGASFDGMSLEEVEYLLQPSDSDNMPTTQSEEGIFLTKIHAHFYRLLKLLLRACCLQGGEVLVMLWPFFELQASPFLSSVPHARLAAMLQCHNYALFEALVGTPWRVRAAVLLGGGWVRAARGHFAQWLSERQGEGRELLPIILFKQLWREDDKSDVENGTQHPFCIPLLRRIITSCGGMLMNAKVAVLVPAGGATVLSRRYSVFPMMRHASCEEEKTDTDETREGKNNASCFMMMEAKSRPLLAALLQATMMPVFSYSVCGATPLFFVSDGLNSKNQMHVLDAGLLAGNGIG